MSGGAAEAESDGVVSVELKPQAAKIVIDKMVISFFIVRFLSSVCKSVTKQVDYLICVSIFSQKVDLKNRMSEASPLFDN